ncbi:hypothetical protein E2562_034113 [Oryza meyeriana var. granulata]|uniref:Uncharacterized protein n=1 Tax=Oryza meyeriana var. granulata TaxID=110450 RepID=A0A6G1E750_9ORYZ|nr:hypothetical protein E2562_034113 [Oryza meyeriana var. granulata]
MATLLEAASEDSCGAGSRRRGCGAGGVDLGKPRRRSSRPSDSPAWCPPPFSIDAPPPTASLRRIQARRVCGRQIQSPRVRWQQGSREAAGEDVRAKTKALGRTTTGAKGGESALCSSSSGSGHRELERRRIWAQQRLPASSALPSPCFPSTSPDLGKRRAEAGSAPLSARAGSAPPPISPVTSLRSWRHAMSAAAAGELPPPPSE